MSWTCRRRERLTVPKRLSYKALGLNHYMGTKTSLIASFSGLSLCLGSVRCCVPSDATEGAWSDLQDPSLCAQV